MTGSIKCESCDFDTTEVQAGMEHASNTGHALGAILDEEGTTLTISVTDGSDVGDDPYYDDYEDDDWNAEDQ